MAEDDFSRTEQPTQKKLDEARQKSGAPTSRDLSTTVATMAGAAILYAAGSYTSNRLALRVKESFVALATFRVSQENCASLLNSTILDLILIAGPIIGLIALSGVVINIAQQGGINISADRIGFKPERLNPIAGFGRLFKKDQILQVGKAFLRIGIVGFIAYRVLSGEMEKLALLSMLEIGEISTYLAGLTFRLIADVCGVLLVLSLADFFYVKWKFIHDNRMTKQEIKEDLKSSEGDPLMKGKIKALQFQASRKRMEKIIPLADVIIVNPTHFAVALKFDRTKMDAPMVIAKGVDALALRMREIARQHGVVIAENKPLARELYKVTKEGEIIPESLYGLVAEVLAYVYSIKGFPQ